VWRTVFKATRLIFLHHETELEEYNNYITSYFASIQPSTHWKVLNLDKAIQSKLVLSITSPSMNSPSSVTWKLAISKATGLVKAVLPPKRKRAQKTSLLPGPAGERLILATCGMRGNVVIEPPHASSGTFANCAKSLITKLLAPARRILMPKQHNVVCHTSELTIGVSGCYHGEHHPYSAVKSHNEPWNLGTPCRLQKSHQP